MLKYSFKEGFFFDPKKKFEKFLIYGPVVRLNTLSIPTTKK
jgi:hypothetical protein